MKPYSLLFEQKSFAETSNVKSKMSTVKHLSTRLNSKVPKSYPGLGLGREVNTEERFVLKAIQ